ncbi:PKD domain-containing protein [uncultured Jatrophihabitans sp.]|uniref:PKD domain-containing protein n=1 Tax=uncultured Jatrophihabitans sp. TaxID=1610747 RepID=UPI0035CBE802
MTLGGNGFCAGDESANCQTAASTYSHGRTTNPNRVWNGPVDCSYPRSGDSVALPKRLSPECNAAPGFDGPSGVGAPTSASAMYSTTAHLSISHPTSARAKRRAALGLAVAQRTRGTRVRSLTWYFGDGSTPAHGLSYHLHHTWKKAGRYTVTVRMYDSRHQYATTHATVRVR